MKQRWIATLLLIVMTAISLSSFPVGVAGEESASLQLNCQAAFICDASQGTVLFEKEADKRVYPASITKVMSTILFMEAIQSGALHYEDKVAASAHAVSMGGSQIWLEVGEEMTVDELLKAVLVGSANDATVALAEAVSGSEEAFVQKMNQKASELGMKNTHFVNAAGLDAENHYTTARDVALMAAELLKYPDVQKYTKIWMEDLRGGKTQLVNTNKLVRSYEGITGLKTGTTGKAGRCLVASAKRGEFHVISVIMGCSDNDSRYHGAEKMLNWAFANFEAVVPKDVTLDLAPLPVLKGAVQQVKVYGDIKQPVIVQKGKADALTYRIQLAENVKAPVEDGQRVGEVQISMGEKLLSTYLIRATERVEEMTFSLALKKLLFALLGIGDLAG